MALAKSPCRESLESDQYFGAGYFDAYEGDSTYDTAFLAMLEEEAALISRYYDLSAEGLNYDTSSAEYFGACAGDLAQLLVELITLRQEMAAYWGYEEYSAFANDFYYYRD